MRSSDTDGDGGAFFPQAPITIPQDDLETLSDGLADDNRLAPSEWFRYY